MIDAAQPVKFKQAGLESRVQYDPYSRKSLLDHFYDDDVSPEALARGEAMERGDFLSQSLRGQDPPQPATASRCRWSARATPGASRIKLTKGVTLDAGSPALEIAYLLEGVPRDRTLHFSVEFDFAGMPSGADDRYFYTGESRAASASSARGWTKPTSHEIGLVDEWLGHRREPVVQPAHAACGRSPSKPSAKAKAASSWSINPSSSSRTGTFKATPKAAGA